MSDIDAARLAEIRETYACDPELAEYAPFDQAKHLGPKPWHTQDPALVAWEEAHRHDARLKCYVEYGCRVIEEEAARDVAFLLATLDAANAEVEQERSYARSQRGFYERAVTAEAALEGTHDAARQQIDVNVLLRQELDAANAAIARVRALHQPVTDGGLSLAEAHCSCRAMVAFTAGDGQRSIGPVGWPCPTTRVLDGEAKGEGQ